MKKYLFDEEEIMVISMCKGNTSYETKRNLRDVLQLTSGEEDVQYVVRNALKTLENMTEDEFRYLDLSSDISSEDEEEAE